MVQIEQRIAALATRYDAVEQGIEALRRLVQQHQQATSTTVAAETPRATTVAHRDPASLDLSALQPCAEDTAEVASLRRWCLDHGLYSAKFQWVPSEYYSKPLQWRRDILQAPSIQQLCKTIVMENTHCVNNDCSDRNNSRYYMIVYQYVEKFDSELVMRYIRGLNEGLGKKKFNFRLADPAVSAKLTGFGHNAVAPFGTAEHVPVILSDKIVSLSPNYFWMGGGHADCKVRVDVEEFIAVINPHIVSFTQSLTPEELETITD